MIIDHVVFYTAYTLPRGPFMLPVSCQAFVRFTLSMHVLCDCEFVIGRTWIGYQGVVHGLQCAVQSFVFHTTTKAKEFKTTSAIQAVAIPKDYTSIADISNQILQKTHAPLAHIRPHHLVVQSSILTLSSQPNDAVSTIILFFIGISSWLLVDLTLQQSTCPTHRFHFQQTIRDSGPVEGLR
jgi:hypothetical protein